MKETINILFTGDFCPHGRIEEMSLKGQFDEVFNNAIDLFRNNDLNVVNLECPLTEIGKGRPKTGPHQKAHPKTIGLLSHVDTGLVCMANNHILDFGAEGATKTLELIEKAGISKIGIGKNQEESRKPYFLSSKGKRIAILNFADQEFITVPGDTIQCNPIHPIHNYEDIHKAKKESDHVIICVHGGNEFYHLPSPRIKQLYRHYIDLGADTVISHHTHAYSGYEVYHDKPIFYGLGNFIYDWAGKRDSSWNQGYFVRLNIAEKVDFEILPYEQCNDEAGVFMLGEEKRKAFSENIQALNQIIEDDELLEKEFIKYCESVLPMYEAFIEPNFGKVITALRKRGLFPMLMGRRKRLYLLNITRCESHKEVLHYLLKKNE